MRFIRRIVNRIKNGRRQSYEEVVNAMQIDSNPLMDAFIRSGIEDNDTILVINDRKNKNTTTLEKRSGASLKITIG